MVQWLEFHTPTAGAMGLVPGEGTAGVGEAGGVDQQWLAAGTWFSSCFNWRVWLFASSLFFIYWVWKFVSNVSMLKKKSQILAL